MGYRARAARGHEIIYPHPPKRLYAQATVALQRMIKQYKIEAIAIGNGTASRESKEFVEETIGSLPLQGKAGEETKTEVRIFTVSEDGASIYSASPTAREEFPDEDVTTRGAVSIGRRLMDPLAELVKIDPKSIGVGQYQHDVDQSLLKHSLDLTVESCVNQVGVNVNTASKHLLTYVSGLGPALAQSIVDYRRENGPFTSRSELKKVKRLGDTAFQQCAGFLRIPGADNPLDNSSVHPESYGIVEHMAKDQGCSVQELIGNNERIKKIKIEKYNITHKEEDIAGTGLKEQDAPFPGPSPHNLNERQSTRRSEDGEDIGLYTLRDILKELEKPGLDPRGEVEVFEFDHNVHTIDDLVEGMELPGIITNITNFGAFVDIGVHQDGLIHISQLADKFVSDPTQVVRLHQHVRVRVTQIDNRRNRIGLSMKHIKQ